MLANFVPVPEATERTPLAGAVPLLEDAPRFLGGRVLLGEGAGALAGTQLREGRGWPFAGLLDVHGLVEGLHHYIYLI